MDYILQMKGVSKIFPGVKALDDINISIIRGETHALCGENGAGKSTLINLLSGVYSFGSYTGEIYKDGELVRFSTIRDSEKAGIACIHQELALAPDLSVEENIFMGNFPTKAGIVQYSEMHDKCHEYLEMVGLSQANVKPSDIISTLAVGQQQLVEIAKAISRKTEILIFDEPSSALTQSETRKLMGVLRQLKAKGVTCILITHKLSEVMEVADSVSVLRDGQHIDSKPIAHVTEHDLITLMVGRELNSLFPREEHNRGDILFEVRNYTVYDSIIPDKIVVDNVSFKVHRGEILGITGLIGSGRTELFSSIFGAYSGKSTGEVIINNRIVKQSKPRDMINLGLFMLTEDRKNFGIIPEMDVKMNTTISNMQGITRCGIFSAAKEITISRDLNTMLSTKMASLQSLITELSGGNQQKVMIARALMCKPLILVMDEPTRGIDVGAKYEIYKIMNRLVSEGVIVILISSEMEEVIGISDRILVFGQGKLKGELQHEEFDPKRILSMGIF